MIRYLEKPVYFHLLQIFRQSRAEMPKSCQNLISSKAHAKLSQHSPTIRKLNKILSIEGLLFSET